MIRLLALLGLALVLAACGRYGEPVRRPPAPAAAPQPAGEEDVGNTHDMVRVQVRQYQVVQPLAEPHTLLPHALRRPAPGIFCPNATPLFLTRFTPARCLRYLLSITFVIPAVSTSGSQGE